ncbi:3-phosphoserine/phosphohydroxythreonine transaminase, partial [Robiginitalea sp.]|nr:3-phosphoserine/phosphohydroxythreonine transaminase [Robiginitalea sp.]
TTNNTIYGTQFKQFPQTDIPLVADMSSDIFSRNLNFAQFDLIYAGAQKNMGPAGVTLVVVKTDILGKVTRVIPSMLDYKLHIAKESMFNTPPVFAVYTSMLTMQWLKDLGGVQEIEKINNQKAVLLYQEIDQNPLFKGYAAREDRSVMNATFNLTNPELQDRFDQLWKSAGILGLKGHRSVGGYRASMYNALSLESVENLVEVMQELGRRA